MNEIEATATQQSVIDKWNVDSQLWKATKSAHINVEAYTVEQVEELRQAFRKDLYSLVKLLAEAEGITLTFPEHWDEYLDEGFFAENFEDYEYAYEAATSGYGWRDSSQILDLELSGTALKLMKVLNKEEQ